MLVENGKNSRKSQKIPKYDIDRWMVDKLNKIIWSIGRGFGKLQPKRLSYRKKGLNFRIRQI